MRRLIKHNWLLAFAMSCVLVCGCSCKGTESRKSDGDIKTSPSASVTDPAAPKANTPTDAASIVAAVQQNIHSDSRIKNKNIQVSCENGIVKLKGRVTTENELHAVGSDARKVDGVQLVANYLSAETYRGSPAQPLPAGYETVIDSILKSIRSDPKVTSTIEISFDPPDPTEKDPGNGRDGAIFLAGLIQNDDQFTALWNDVLKMTDLPLMSSYIVLHDPTQWSPADPPPPLWKGPSPSDKPVIPLCAGLSVITAIASPGGDYESIKTIESVDSRQLRLKYSAEVMPPWWETSHPELKRTVTHRNVLTTDLESAHNYAYIFNDKSPETAEDATAIGTSAAMLRELKARGESELGLCTDAGGVPIREKDGQEHAAPGCFSPDSRPIKRLENEPVLLRVLVNGVPTDLPTVHALGKWGHDKRSEFFFLDDERNPLTIKFRMDIGGVPALRPSGRDFCDNVRTKGNYGPFLGDDPPSCDLPDGGDRTTLRVVKIDTRCEVPGAKANPASAMGGEAGGAAGLEKSLVETGKVDVYSIYFSFTSDLVRDESEPTLREIAEVLRRHRDWRLRVAGHTDGIGGDQQNLELSKRRAAAVKDALVKRYGIAASRLETTGFGKSQPKDTNDTLEGRAHNRRVELMRVS